ncbi:MAG TPA: peptidoglycan DD-metalloendopeptidase family protein [Candidatus Babeliales bacterium]|nr:peptidoglycan DD-metalloendopeptidase family protein [Candidatus Babeliales bacterium]
MNDKSFPIVYSVLFSFLASIMIFLMILLFLEYRFFCQHAKELIELKFQYAEYVELLDKKLSLKDELIDSYAQKETEDGAEYIQNEHLEENIVDNMDEFLPESSSAIKEIMQAEASDAPDNDDEYADDSFVVINRHPDYLKQSTLDYMQSQELNTLMTSLDIDRWSDYAAGIVTPKKITPKKIDKNSTGKPIPKITAVRPLIKDCGFIWPIDSDKFWVSSLFGPRKRIDGTWGFHHGIDMAAIKGTLVKVVRAGTVTEASFQTGYGNTVVVQHSDTLKTRYAHLHTIRVCAGQKIKQGVIIGTVGETGFIRKKGKDGSHLHFEVYERGKRINPMHCLPRV